MATQWSYNLKSNISQTVLGGRIAQWRAFSLCTQQPWVRFSAFPKKILRILEEIIGCCRDLLTALLRKVNRGLIMSIEPI